MDLWVIQSKNLKIAPTMLKSIYESNPWTIRNKNGLRATLDIIGLEVKCPVYGGQILKTLRFYRKWSQIVQFDKASKPEPKLCYYDCNKITIGARINCCTG